MELSVVLYVTGYLAGSCPGIHWGRHGDQLEEDHRTTEIEILLNEKVVGRIHEIPEN
jgi:hypothetical protein